MFHCSLRIAVRVDTNESTLPLHQVVNDRHHLEGEKGSRGILKSRLSYLFFTRINQCNQVRRVNTLIISID